MKLSTLGQSNKNVHYKIILGSSKSRKQVETLVHCMM
jgi:hypothetical protein